MNGPIAQIVALTVHGNAILRKIATDVNFKFQKQNSTFTFCEFVNFIESPSGGSTSAETIYAVDPHDWFDRLRSDEVRSLRLCHEPSPGQKIPDRMLAGFVGGGGKWLLEARRRNSADIWEAHWRLGDREREDKKIWRVSYVRALRTQALRTVQPANLYELQLKLGECLSQIAKFAWAENLEWFAKAFEKATARLQSPSPLEGVYHTDIALPGFVPLIAIQLLGCAQDAWVFGGMGSWNDLSFEGPAKAAYEKLSEELFQLVIRAMVAAANSSGIS